ncbi:MAG: MFS transporter [Clostridia bacterium]|nr:MFS transporter [Clostridia bacterium]
MSISDTLFKLILSCIRAKILFEMATILLIFIYIIYIGLGTPDSITGAAWTSIATELSLPLGYESIITFLISFCTVLASFFSVRLINKIGAGVVTTFSTFLTALALLAFSYSQSIYALSLCAIPAGLGAGAIDSALNNYVSVNYKPALVNFLHCFYGIGVFLSPYVFSFTLKNGDWRLGYKIVFLIQLGLSVVSLISLIFWKKVKREKVEQGLDIKPITLSYKTMAKNKAIRISWLIFFSTCALEFSCNFWSATYLEKYIGTTADNAALILSLYFIGITTGRFISGLLSTKIAVRKIIFTGYTVVLIALTLLFIPSSIIIKSLAIVLIGVGNGPTFPNLSHLTPKYFGEKYSQSIISSQMVMCNIGIMLMPTLFGSLVKKLSLAFFPIFITVFFFIMVISTIIYFSRVDKNLHTIIEKEN